MANFRAERVFIMLDSPIAGVDHLRATNPERFCDTCMLTRQDSVKLGLEPLLHFAIAAGERSWEPREGPQWRPAVDGLVAVRGLLAYYQGKVSKGEESEYFIAEQLPAVIESLQQVEAVLDKADTYDRQFCFAVKDLA